MSLFSRLKDKLTDALSTVESDVSAADFPDTPPGRGDDGEEDESESAEEDSDEEPDGEEESDDTADGDGSSDDTDADDEGGDGEAESDEDEDDEDGEDAGSDDRDGDDSSADDKMGEGTPPDSDTTFESAEHRPSSEEMAERDEEAFEERYDVRIKDIDKYDERDEARWARLMTKLDEYGSDIERRKRERNERIENHRSRRFKPGTPNSSEALRTQAEQKGIIRELEEGFRELVSRETPQPARTGPRIDMDNVVRRAAGDTTVTELFESPRVTEVGDRCIGIAADISGSMGSDINGLKIAAGCVAEACSIVGDEFVFEAFTDIPSEHGSRDALDLRIVTGPNEEFDWTHLDSFKACRNEPTAAGIRDCRMLMEQTDAREYIMIVITDGMALITEDGRQPANNEPVKQAREAVNECRADGIDVIGLGIGSMDESDMETTFGGGNFRLAHIDTLAETILDLYRDQMRTT